MIPSPALSEARGSIKDRIPGLGRRIKLTHAWQFALACVPVLLAGMAIIGFWVSANIERAILQNRADATALFVDSIISPLAQDLSSQTSLDEQSQSDLVAAIYSGPLASRIFSFKIWTRGGKVAFSTDPELVGKAFPPQASLQKGLDGIVTAEFDPLHGEEHSFERISGLPFIEIHSPIRDAKTGDVVGVAEFYERSSEILKELRRSHIRSWLVVAGVTIGMLTVLFLIVARGSAQIERQRRRLDDQVRELSQLLDLNTVLRQRVDEASQRTVALNERYLRRISSDLHDGPTQLLGFAIMRLEAIRKGKGREDDEGLIRSSVQDAIDEIRNICRDLRLPELEGLSGREVAARAIKAHELHSGIQIDAEIAEIDVASQGARICIYRFLQETLSNASRHADATRITVLVKPHLDGIEVLVEDDGIGFTADPDNAGLGLSGLEERIASLGGRMEISSGGSVGTAVRMVLP
ncbi:Signal transduction histidine kinase [Rhizobium sp. NFR07]|uniref:sensor histidine kinase n=1 Tax=Rhizobium sp. NFR07 TaxID=1566262 RepID=UPI0008E53CBB|nr:sensor histidine kinase [Rhizobium sp. NFR07]SFA76294.1 Signal transduction histidine kinase [Rhizobium sp. NFR07]